MEINKVQWRMIAKGEKLPCDSFLMKKDGTIISMATGAGVTVGQDAYYLPVEELRSFPKEESEDERIRKAIIEIVKKDEERIGVNAHLKKIQWLEKQGEQKSIEYPLCKTVKDKIDYYIVNHFTTDTVVKTDVNSIVKAMEEGVMIGMSEQKPADKVEPSIFKDRLLELFQIFRWRCKDHILTNGEILEYVDAHIQELIGTMQKPADTEKGANGNDREIPNSAWSEEDEARFESCIKVLQTSDGYDTINAKWLKSLKGIVQPQKQEWSEKDKCMLNNVIDTLKPLSQTTHSGYAINSMIDWLKSLKERYTWKPSDEQIKVCKEVYADILSAKGFDLGTVNSELNRLEEELKKLREA